MARISVSLRGAPKRRWRRWLLRVAELIAARFGKEGWPTALATAAKFCVKHPLAAFKYHVRSSRWGNRLSMLHRYTRRIVHTPSVTIDLPEMVQKGRPLCVLVHVYYPELWAELSSYIANLPHDIFDLYVNLVDDTFDQALLASVRADFPEARVYISANAGSDIGGHFRMLANVRLEQYAVCCLLHTKKSSHMSKRKAQLWRRDLLDPILGSPQVAAANVQAMLADSTIGQIGAKKCQYSGLDGNRQKYFDLLKKLGILEGESEVEFLSGTMMFLRRDVLQRIFCASSDFAFAVPAGSPPKYRRDGQWAHAVERAFGAAVRHMGYRSVWR